ncbi:MAG: hypothetical protein K1X88_07430 [Nannocystaceae bacterium]|nr:hypothetical protein [Nannocystaceae bacterium]
MLAAALGIAWGGCDRDAAPTTSPEPTATRARGLDDTAARMLAHVPARTPYVWAGVEPPSERQLRQLRPLLDASLAAIAEQLDAATATAPEAAALLAVLRGHMDRAGLVALGLRSNPHWVVYGIGLAPVVRIELGDPARVQASIDAIDRADGHSAHRTIAGHPTWTWGSGELELAVAIDGETLVLAAYPSRVRESMLAHVAGAAAPADSLARSRWYEQARGEHDLLGAAIGMVDLERALALARGEGTPLERAITAAWFDDDLARDDCAAGVLTTLHDAPRLWFGPRAIDGARLEAVTIWELSPRVEDELRGIVAPLPGLERGALHDALAAVALGIDSDATLALVQRWLDAPALRACGLAPEQTAAPPWLRGLRGASLVVDAWHPERNTGDGALALGVIDPLRWLADALPSIDRSALAHVGRPVRLLALDPTLGDPTLREGWAARGRDRLAVALGQGARHRVRRAVSHAQRNRGHLAVASIDVHGWTELYPRERLRALVAASDPSERALTDAIVWAIDHVEASLLVVDGGLELRGVTTLRPRFTRR